MSLNSYVLITPARNEDSYIEKTIESVICQTLLPDKWVIVSDASTDRTGEVAIGAGCRVVTHPYNLGNGAAVKGGIRAAEGEIVLMMDGDGQHRPEVIPSIL